MTFLQRWGSLTLFFPSGFIFLPSHYGGFVLSSNFKNDDGGSSMNTWMKTIDENFSTIESVSMAQRQGLKEDTFHHATLLHIRLLRNQIP